MLIRDAQVKILNDHAATRFVDEMIVHLGRYAPARTAILGSEGLPRYIRSGLERAALYNWGMRGTARFYLELMLFLGVGFDTDPQYPWLHRLLHNSTAGDQMMRAMKLHEQVSAFAGAASGEGGRNHTDAVAKLRAFLAPDTPLVRSAEWRIQMRNSLTGLHPERAGFAGEDALDQVVRIGRRAAMRLRLRSSDTAGYIAASFLIGHHFTRDPQYPWAASISAPEPGSNTVTSLASWVADRLTSTAIPERS